MNQALRRIAFFVGIGLLLISMYWSQDGFNFDLAGDSGYGNLAVVIACFLAIAVTVMEFVFSSSFKDLNSSLILFGILAYVYSIYTNHGGIVHFQGLHTNEVGAWILAVIMDAVPEPLIAWGLYESKTGDFVGNLVKSIVSAPDKVSQQNQSFSKQHQYTPIYPPISKLSKKGKGRVFQETNNRPSVFSPSDTQPNKVSRFNLKGE